MNIKTTLPISEARKKIFQIAEDVAKTSRHYTLTDKGRAKAILVSPEEYESWIETFEVMREMPDLEKDIKEAHADYKSGKYKKYTTIEAYSKQHALSSATKTKSRKRAQ